MTDPMDKAAEVRELCVSLAVQAGAKEPDHIISIADKLRFYIQTGEHTSGGGEGSGGKSSATLRSVHN